ncbi:RNA polymerase sigma factor RpoD/SigA [Candidatus Sumerlaeota bacterium]|nr:RNA polymerase sigma factor RpoD/SigA [Candidatus Sumerlaeota bacterium]
MKQFEEEIKWFINEASQFPVLTREEETALFKRLEKGDKSVFDLIVKHNLRFVIKIALHYTGRGLPLSDLIQEGNIGLLEVIPKYDHRKGYRFSTYAAFWIKQSIQIALRKNGNIISIPIRKARLIGHISEAINNFTQDHGYEPSVSDIARILDEKEENIESMMKLRESVLSLDNSGDEDNISPLERIPDQQVKSPLEYSMENQARIKVAALLKLLSEKEQRIMRLRYGFEHGRNLSLRKISRLVGLSQEGVRRIERKALEKLRRPTLRARMDALL